MFSTDTQRWSALVRRSARAAGAFVYGVKTTGVYCRPTCSSRLPKRANVEFFAAAADAEQAGYRACRRCRPHATPPRTELVHRVCAFIEAHLEDRATLATLAGHVGLSRFHLQRVFKDTLGVTPREYQEMQRVKRFKSSLRNGATVTAAIHAAGFGSSSRWYEQANRRLGMRPKAYRDKGAGVRIGFAIIDTTLGKVLVAATPQGLCQVAFGNDKIRLETDLRAEFSKASIECDPGGLKTFTAKISEYLSGHRKIVDLPLDIQVTAFQRRVWELLRKIPYGETRSYGDIARQLGNPKAVRAVASACAHNPVAMVIPCHRVVRKGGDLAGYRWGLERKAALLTREKKRRR